MSGREQPYVQIGEKGVSQGGNASGKDPRRKAISLMRVNNLCKKDIQRRCTKKTDKK